jgi:hypothetical protein
MKAVWQGLGRLCLTAVMCLAARNGLPALPASAESCAEAIADGGFETGGAWQPGSTPFPPEYVTYTSHTGARSLVLGIMQGANASSYSSAKQLVTIPVGATRATLSFWVYAVVGDQPGADKMQLLLLDPAGATLAVIWTSSSNNPTWSQLTYDVTQWRGQSVQVYFNVINDGAGGTTGMFLDDVSLAVCPDSSLAAATAQPAAAVADEDWSDSPPSATPSTSPAEPLETPAPVVETPAAVFFTREVDVDSELSQAGLQALQIEPVTPAASESSPSSGTPAMVFFTPTPDSGLSPTALHASQAGAGTAEQQLTRVSLMVTPAGTLTLRPTRGTAVPLATRGTLASQAPKEAPFAQWPKGWWFAVGAVFAIILAAGLIARRSG